MRKDQFDVVVVGAGTGGLCAALAANEAGAKTCILEYAPEEHRGGNSAYASGSFRFTFEGLDDLLQVIPDLSPAEIENTDFGSYKADQYFDDMERVTEGRCDPDLVEALVRRSFDTARWMRSKGARFLPNYKRQSYKEGNKVKFSRGCTIEVSGGGHGLVTALFAAVDRAQIPVFYETRGEALLHGDHGVFGVRARGPEGVRELHANAVIIAAGGFESNAEWRSRYLGPGWDLARVRGTRFNTGDGIRMALDIGASAAGHWSGCHAVAWDLFAPEFGDLSVGNGFKKDSYQYSIVVNADGERFIDEGADYRNFTYAKYGGMILRQPHQFAWQVFDAKVSSLLRREYRIRRVTKVTADSLEELATKLTGVNPRGFLKTVREFNAAVQTDVPFNANVKDGRGANDLKVAKSNWANTIDTPPFEAYAVTCGVTFTFGGLRINADSAVIGANDRPIPGLFACGSSAGGLFYFNYPGGAGLVSAAVFGKTAGEAAAKLVQNAMSAQ